MLGIFSELMILRVEINHEISGTKNEIKKKMHDQKKETRKQK